MLTDMKVCYNCQYWLRLIDCPGNRTMGVIQYNCPHFTKTPKPQQHRRKDDNQKKGSNDN